MVLPDVASAVRRTRKSRIELGSHSERMTTRPHGTTWPTARAGGLHTIQHAYQAQMPPTHELRAA